MRFLLRMRVGWAALVMAAVCPLAASANERVTLKNGFEMECSRREVVGDRVRLYLVSGNSGGSVAGEGNYVEVAADDVARVETVPDAPRVMAPATSEVAPVAVMVPSALKSEPLTKAEMHTMLAHAGEAHNIDEDLLASVVRAESGGQVRARSRVGAEGLMQLMPKTASELGVKDAYQPEENIAGGSAYLDQLLKRYNDNVALALAAYNAGPAAVDKYHGVPPYRETRAYVARVIREFNHRKLAAARASIDAARAGVAGELAQSK